VGVGKALVHSVNVKLVFRLCSGKQLAYLAQFQEDVRVQLQENVGVERGSDFSGRSLEVCQCLSHLLVAHLVDIALFYYRDARIEVLQHVLCLCLVGFPQLVLRDKLEGDALHFQLIDLVEAQVHLLALALTHEQEVPHRENPAL
jgi:hypothetical protein